MLSSRAYPRQKPAHSLDPVRVLMLVGPLGTTRRKAVEALRKCDGAVEQAELLLIDPSGECLQRALLNQAKATTFAQGPSAQELEYALLLCNYDMEQARFHIANTPLELAARAGLLLHQEAGFSHVAKQARLASSAAKSLLQKRWDTEGISSTLCALDVTLNYVRDRAPIIVHFNAQRILHHLVRDTHYRNAFEVHPGSHSSREQWERRMFGTHYDRSSPQDRVKYGVFNITHDHFGVSSCSTYGLSYLVLKNVRLRTTFADKDTSNTNSVLATCQDYCHVLLKYSTEELRAVAEVAGGHKPCGRSSDIMSIYKEVQIHGPIKLDEHVQVVAVSNAELNQMGRKNEGERLMQAFREKHGVEIFTIGNRQTV